MAPPCFKCGEDIAEKDDEDPIVRDGESYCGACYLGDYTFTCTWCGESAEELATQHDYVMVFDAAEAGLALPGLYRVRDHDYVTHGLIGGGWLHPWALQWLGPIPAGLEEPDGYACGHCCQACQRRLLRLLAAQGLIQDVA